MGTPGADRGSVGQAADVGRDEAHFFGAVSEPSGPIFPPANRLTGSADCTDLAFTGADRGRIGQAADIRGRVAHFLGAIAEPPLRS